MKTLVSNKLNSDVLSTAQVHLVTNNHHPKPNTPSSLLSHLKYHARAKSTSSTCPNANTIAASSTLVEGGGGVGGGGGGVDGEEDNSRPSYHTKPEVTE